MEIALLQSGTLYIAAPSEPIEQGVIDPDWAKKIGEAFDRGSAAGILELATNTGTTDISPSVKYWKEFGQLFLSQLCTQEDLEKPADTCHVSPADNAIHALAESAPPFIGAENMTAALLTSLWEELNQFLLAEARPFSGTLRDFIKKRFPLWAHVGRVYFHLAENKKNTKAQAKTPFAFLATYTTHVASAARVQHLPLGAALKEYAGQKNKQALLALLKPVQRAAQESPFLKELVDSGKIYQPIAWQPSQALSFLKAVPQFEANGILVRVPNSWHAKRPARAQVTVQIGNNTTTRLGADALLDFDVGVCIDGERLSDAEWETIRKSDEKLVFLKGKWVEVDSQKLQQMLHRWQGAAQATKQGGVSFIEGMRLLSGANIGKADEDAPTAEWSQVIAGSGLASIIDSLQDPKKTGHEIQREIEAVLGQSLKATLRHYQTLGVQWLWLLHSLGLGGCLADDMGLGKTIQVISLLLVIKERRNSPVGAHGRAPLHQGQIPLPHLLIVPASLLGNWATEIERFAPGLTYRILHGSFLSREALESLPSELFSGVDLVITTYQSVFKMAWLTEREWGCVILDEAQAIKNPEARQTRAVKKLNAKHKLILTGTPIENRLGDLWSLFDFVCPGLLGSSAQFNQFIKSLAKREPPSYAPLRKLVAPYILRRLKTDKAIIADLPDKTELTAFCSLSKRQAALYQRAVEELTRQLDTPLEDMKRRGIILAFLLRLKQICNHPSQWLGDGAFVPEESGKFARLSEICETIAARQEKALIFTQFREIIPILHDYLKEMFHRPGLILHGGTPIGERKQRVDAFQQELGPPYFILSLKAGGTGLNLTAASHVIHFDRWWNPAVENQATDRAYRIGQKKNILVHKFVCRGTIEEKIDRMIEEKKGLSNEILEGGSEALLTEMDNKELLRMVSLDIHAASTE